MVLGMLVRLLVLKEVGLHETGRGGGDAAAGVVATASVWQREWQQPRGGCK